MTSQLDIFTDYAPRSRRTDPDTSHESANRVDEFASKHHREILAALRASAVPLAAEQIADAIGSLDFTQVGKRISELRDAGLIVRTEERHVNRSGRAALKYRTV